ncbi:MAG: MCP four helix bundle domain-containing protein, partial [Acidobacteriaceae bacterium]
MTIGKRFIITSGILILLSTILAVVSIMGFNSVSTNATALETNAIPGILYASDLRADINDLRGNYLSNISSSDPAEIAKLEQNEAAVKALIAEDLKGYEPTIVDAE